VEVLVSALERPVVLHWVVDSSGQGAWFGDKQAAWLVDHGHVAAPTVSGDRYEYRAVDPDDSRAVAAIVEAQPDLRECDFCRQVPTRWEIQVRPFVLHVGPPETRPARVARPMYACDVCAGYVERNDKHRLVEYSVASHVEYARAQGGYLEAVVLTNPRGVLDAAIRPMVRETVFGMFANRRGRPQSIKPTSAGGVVSITSDPNDPRLGRGTDDEP
jgi:hypothetical protein